MNQQRQTCGKGSFTRGGVLGLPGKKLRTGIEEAVVYFEPEPKLDHFPYCFFDPLTTRTKSVVSEGQRTNVVFIVARIPGPSSEWCD